MSALYVVAYDIADPRRLRRVAYYMERRALRCQKSVFLFTGDEAAVTALLDEAAPLLDPEQDVVQAWKLSPGQPPAGLARGTPQPVTPAGVVLSPGRQLFIRGS
jgi:CRISPR-associated protein Cas2